MVRSIQNSLCKSIVGVKVSVTHGCELIWWYNSMTGQWKSHFM